MSTQKIASSTLWQIASQGVMAALSIVTVKLVATGLSKHLAGDYNTAYGYLQLFGIFADFGLYAVAVRELSKAKDKEKMLGALIVLRSGILLLSMAAALTVAWITPHWQGTPLPIGITIAAFVPSLTLLAGILRTVFQVEYRMGYVFIAEVTQRVLTVSLTALFIIAGVRNSDDPTILYWFLGIGSAGALLLLLLSIVFSTRFIRIRPCFDWSLQKNLLLQALPYGVAFLCTALYRQFDVTLIAQLRPHDFEEQNAYYGFVQRMMDMAYLLPTFLLNSTLPILAARHDKGEDTRPLLGKILLSITLLSITSLLFASLWARPLTHLLTTEHYLSMPGQPGSDTALSILSVSMFMNGFILFAFYGLLTTHRWRPLVATLSIGVLVAITMNVWLIPTLGFVGASYTSVTVHTLLAILLLPQALRILPSSVTAQDLLRLLAYIIVLGAALFFARPLLTGDLRTALGMLGACGLLAVLIEGLGLRRLLLNN